MSRQVRSDWPGSSHSLVNGLVGHTTALILEKTIGAGVLKAVRHTEATFLGSDNCSSGMARPVSEPPPSIVVPRLRFLRCGKWVCHHRLDAATILSRALRLAL
jgi:hypothetical protein